MPSAGKIVSPTKFLHDCATAHHETDDKEHEKQEQNFGDTGCPCSDSSETEDCTTDACQDVNKIERARGSALDAITRNSAEIYSLSSKHEIALHGWIHESLPALNDAAEEERLLNQAIDYLTKVAGRRPVGTRAGAWALSPYSIDIIRKAKLLYDSSMMARDEPYEVMTDGSDLGSPSISTIFSFFT